MRDAPDVIVTTVPLNACERATLLLLLMESNKLP